jgi:hypothetical protein
MASIAAPVRAMHPIMRWLIPTASDASSNTGHTPGMDNNSYVQALTSLAIALWIEGAP